MRAGAPPALVIAWLSGRSEKTVRAYRRDLEDFSRFIGAKSIDQAITTICCTLLTMATIPTSK